MKVFKKILSVFLTMAIMLSMICVGTVNAGAAESDLPYVEMSENSYYKTLTYTLWLQGNQAVIAADDTYLSKKCPNGEYYGLRYDLILEDGTNKYQFSIERYKLNYSWWFYENGEPVLEKVSTATISSTTAEKFIGNIINFSIPTDSSYYSKLKKCTKAFVANCTVWDNSCCKPTCADGTKKDSELGYTEVELHNLNVKLEEIQNKTKNISSLSITKPSNKTYTGKNRKAAVTIKDGNKTLEKGKDYTLSYKNCKEIGTATVTIKGKGNYTGTKTLTYKIVPKKTTLKVAKSSDTKAKFTWTAVDGAEKYQIYYSTNGGKYKKLATVSGSKTSYTSTKLDFKKNDYKFKIRSYATSDDAKYYSSYSKAVAVK
ncbi:MAG: hypothetical protein IJ385_05665 [Ruminiclostridium sp.]|nr:hypothetical protein [Ruminiclostridium sp.]